MRKLVYLLDESNTVRQAVEMVTRHEKGFEVKTFSDADSCHAAIKRLRPAALLVDGTLADSLSWISMGELVSIPLVKLRAVPDADAADELKKPFNSRMLVDCIQQAFDRGEAQAPTSLQDLMEVTEEAAGREPRPFLGSQQADIPSMSTETMEALARKTIEEVVWEVVPKLAESMLKEAIEKEMAKRRDQPPAAFSD